VAGALVSAARKVHDRLENGRLPRAYQDASSTEFEAQQISYERNHEIPDPSMYGVMTCMHRADFLCYNNLLVELTTDARISAEDVRLTIKRLNNAGLHRAVLVCLGSDELQYQKVLV
jgi:GxxExxY protein